MSRRRSPARQLLIGLSALGLVGVTSCSTPADQAEEGAAAAQSSRALPDLNIGYFTTGSTNAYQNALNGAVADTAESLGASVDTLEANFDVQTQINQMQLALTRESYNAWIVVAASGEQECDQIQQAVAAGIPVVVLVTQVCGDGLPGAVSFVGVQTPQAYTDWWDLILSENPDADMAVVTGPDLVDITQYAQATLDEALAQYPGVNVVANQQTDYTTEQAFTATQNLLQANPGIDVIASNYAGMTQGVVQAVEAAGLTGQVKIYDLLADQYVIDQIKAGVVTATLPGLPATEGETATRILADFWRGNDVEGDVNPADSLDIPNGPFIDQSNVDSFTAEY